MIKALALLSLGVAILLITYSIFGELGIKTLLTGIGAGYFGAGMRA